MVMPSLLSTQLGGGGALDYEIWKVSWGLEGISLRAAVCPTAAGEGSLR